MAHQQRDCLVFDDFLEPGLHEALLAHTLAQADAHEPSRVYDGPELRVDRAARSSEFCTAGLGNLHDACMDRVLARLDTMLAALGIADFPVAFTEVELIAHNDGARFGCHIDTLAQGSLEARDTTRILSLVYYFHRHPKGFGGGEIRLLPIGAGDPQTLEPRDNRLIAFPSYLPHEVHEVSCPSREFADSRFAINIWFCRARAAG